MPITITSDPDADRLLTENPLALLIGMLLDLQVPMETAFAGPAKLRERMGGVFTLAAMSVPAAGATRYGFALFSGGSLTTGPPGTRGRAVFVTLRGSNTDW